MSSRPTDAQRAAAPAELRNSEGQLEQRRTGDANLGEDGSNIDDSGPDKELRSPVGLSAASVPEAIAAIMDTPHPLDILGEPGSYGFSVRLLLCIFLAPPTLKFHQV